MNIIHLGGEKSVTGSCHLLRANGLNIMGIGDGDVLKYLNKGAWGSKFDP